MLRWLVFVVLAGSGAMLLGRLLLAAARHKELEGELGKRLWALKGRVRGSRALKDGLETFDQVRRLLAKSSLESGERKGLLEDAVGVLEELERQGELKARLKHALTALESAEQNERIRQVEEKLASVASEEARKTLEETLAQLRGQRQQVVQLRDRLAVFEASELKTVADLEEVRLALLEAATSSGGIESQRADAIRTQLTERAEGVRRETAAAEEVARLLAG